MAIAQESREILPLSQVRPGMQGYAYTIFAGDQVERFDLKFSRPRQFSRPEAVHHPRQLRSK